MKQEALAIANAGIIGNITGDVTSGTSNGSLEKKEATIECLDPLAAEHVKELTPPASKSSILLFFFCRK